MNSSLYRSILEQNVTPVRLPAKTCLELGHATGQQSQAQQQISSRMVEKVKNEGAAMVQTKSRQMPPNLNELR